VARTVRQEFAQRNRLVTARVVKEAINCCH